MKKVLIILCSVIFLAAGVVALAGCTDNEDPPVTERVAYSQSDNPYSQYGWQEIATTDDWDEKWSSAPIYYQFEGMYEEAYQSSSYKPDYMLLNCYEDGSVHGRLRNASKGYRIDNFYGYWTNQENSRNKPLVLHILNSDNAEYNGGYYEMPCDMPNDDYFEFYSNIAIKKYGTQRTMTISGYRYSPVKSLSVSGGQTKAMIGDKFSIRDLTVTLTRENGKFIEYESRELDLRFEFEGFDSSEEGVCEVLVKCTDTDVKTSYKCEVCGIKELPWKTSAAKFSGLIPAVNRKVRP